MYVHLQANTVPYHYDGANAVQELAIALAIASKHAKQAGSLNHLQINFSLTLQLIHNSSQKLQNFVHLKYYGKHLLQLLVHEASRGTNRSRNIST